jgi:hypothetical protein
VPFVPPVAEVDPPIATCPPEPASPGFALAPPLFVEVTPPLAAGVSSVLLEHAPIAITEAKSSHARMRISYLGQRDSAISASRRTGDRSARAKFDQVKAFRRHTKFNGL